MREERIVDGLRAGDPAALEELMDLYIPYVSAVVWNILRFSMSKEDGEEVVSDVFLSVWQHAEEVMPGSLKSWLGTVARNRAKNKLRELGRTLPLEEDALPGCDAPSAGLERSEERRLVRRALGSLSKADQEIFLRHYYYAQTVQEIAQRMALPPSTVKTRLRRGRMKLKELLTREGFTSEA